MNDDRAYLKAVASLGCIICGSPAEVHHIREGVGMAQRNDNWNILPLCPAHHRTGGVGIAFHAGAESFALNYGTERELERQVHKAIYGFRRAS